MKKEYLIRSIIRLFTCYGIKRVSMDMIAKLMCISKKTIYELFDNKENLIYECLKSKIQSYINNIEIIELKAHSTIDIIFSINIELYRQFSEWNPIFFNDLENYPEIKSQLYDNYTSYIRSKYIILFKKGIDEALFREEINPELIVNFFEQQLQPAKKQHSDKINDNDLFILTILTFLIGISTDKGRKNIDIYLAEYKLNNKII